MKDSIPSYSLVLAALTSLLACSPDNPAPGSTSGDSKPSTPSQQVGGAGSNSPSNPSNPAVTPPRAGTGAGGSPASTPAAGGTAGNRGNTAGGGSATTTVTGGSGSVAEPDETGTPAVTKFDLTPTKRNPKYESLAPPMAEPLPRENMGTWNWTDVEGAVSRDGSPAGFYYKYSTTGSKNLLVYLVGGGVCPDNSFCNINPANKNQSLTAEGILAGTGNAILQAPEPEPQDPNLERWKSGLFKDDPANPVRDWNVVFVPYVTGDVFFGTRPNGTIPDVPGMFQFVGKINMQKFLGRIVPTFSDSQIVMLAGSSAGGIGALLNATYFADAFIDQGNGARMVLLDDAGPFFEDEYLEVCIQKRYRDTFGLDESFPKDCEGCVTPDGGGLAKGVLTYLMDKYPGERIGGLIDSNEDEIMKFFFSEGQENCSYIDNPIAGLLVYPPGLYPRALGSLLKLVPANIMSSYIWEGTLHQNVFQTASADRFYEKNGLNQTVAEWLTDLLAGKGTRIGSIQ